jgi:hypothetical protein
MKKQEVIEVVCIMLLALVVSVSLLTTFRTCEILQDGQVIRKSCYEVKSFEN